MKQLTDFKRTDYKFNSGYGDNATYLEFCVKEMNRINENPKRAIVIEYLQLKRSRKCALFDVKPPKVIVVCHKRGER